MGEDDFESERDAALFRRAVQHACRLGFMRDEDMEDEETDGPTLSGLVDAYATAEDREQGPGLDRILEATLRRLTLLAHRGTVLERLSHEWHELALQCHTCQRHFAQIGVLGNAEVVVRCPGCKAEGR